MARHTSVNKLKNNFSISQDKTENYISALMESYLLFQLRKFSFSLKSSLRSGFKPYAVATGLRKRIAFDFSEDTGWLVENAVFCHLNQHHDEVYYDTEGGETDFIVKEGLKIVRRIQVWYDDSSVKTVPEREISCFIQTPKGYEKAEKILLTNDYDETIMQSDGPVRCIPVIPSLLDNDI